MKKKSNILRGIIFTIIVLLLWELGYLITVKGFHIWKSYMFPSPEGVWNSFLTLMINGSLLRATLYSLFRGLIGYLIAILVGSIIGIMINQVALLKQFLKPVILGIQTLPSICWVPFSILWFGLSQRSIIFVVVMGATFSIAISVDQAIEQVPSIYKKAALTMGATKRQMYISVILPAAVPALISGLKQGWSFSWRALMSGEVMTTCVGLGQTLIIGRDMADINQVMLVMIVIVVVGILIDKYLFSVLEKKFTYKL